MADPALIALVVGALATILLVAFVLIVQIGRIRGLYEQATTAFGRLETATQELSAQQAVLDAELAALGDAMEALRASRDVRATRDVGGRGELRRRELDHGEAGHGDLGRDDGGRGDGAR